MYGEKAVPEPCFHGDFIRKNDAISVQVVTPFNPEVSPFNDKAEIKFFKEWPETKGKNSKKMETGAQGTKESGMTKPKENGFKNPIKTGVCIGTDDARISVTNMVSVSLLITTKSGHRVLYCGDAPKNRLLEGLKRLDEEFETEGIDVDVLWVPHHGSKNNTDQDFFEKVRASVYIFLQRVVSRPSRQRGH